MPSLAAPAAPAPALPTRQFGRYELLRLLCKSDLTMVWLAVDVRTRTEAMLTMPRIAPAGAAGVAAWLANARRAARISHPDIARVVACDVHDHCPYVAIDRRLGVTLEERLAAHARPGCDEAAGWFVAVLRGLAYAHEAGISHHDLQSHAILINDRGDALVAAFGVGRDHGEVVEPRSHERALVVDPLALRGQREAAEHDVVAAGLLLHRLLAGEAALGTADTGRAIARMSPRGRELVRLPWTTPQPIAEALRAIVNRSTSAQERLRYRSARTFLGALTGWRDAATADSGGPVALLIDRLRTVGHLPALPGLAQRVQRVTAIETQRTADIARHLLPDLGLSLELLRMLNSAHVQGTQIPGNGAVLTLRRVVALIGVNGVREAANTLRSWPGPLDETGEKALLRSMERVRLAGHLAQALRPAGYDAEVVYLVAALQNLGRLLLRYHFADEAAQIHQLMQPATGTDRHEQPGLDEAAAAYAVLGVDVEAFGSAVARHWGFDDAIVHMGRRLPAGVSVRKPDNDDELLRIVASLANEIVDAISDIASTLVADVLSQLVQRYGRVLKLSSKILADAVRDARASMGTGGTAPSAGGQRTGNDDERPASALAGAARARGAV